MTEVYVYLRVSGRGQLDGDGFDRQLLACEKYAAENGYKIAEVFREEGVSGTKELGDRPALANLFVALEENGVTIVLIEKVDRLARDLMVQETIIADMRKQGYTLISCYEPDLCSDDPSRKLMRQLMGAIAEYDRAMIVQKLRAARQRKKARQGKCEGQHAFGEKPHEVVALDRIRVGRSAGFTFTQIAVDLNNQNLSSRSGRPWHRSTIAKIVRRLEAA